MEKDLFSILDEIIEKDPRYKMSSYTFVLAALSFTLRKLGKTRHITGKELLEGIREYGIQQFGPMTRYVFENWGVHRSEDFGNIVFNLVEAKLLGKTEEDSIEDFANWYDFEEIFEKNYPWGAKIKGDNIK